MGIVNPQPSRSFETAEKDENPYYKALAFNLIAEVQVKALDIGGAKVTLQRARPNDHARRKIENFDQSPRSLKPTFRCRPRPYSVLSFYRVKILITRLRYSDVFAGRQRLWKCLSKKATNSHKALK